MSNSFVPYFCSVCGNILNVYNMESRSIVCTKCKQINHMANNNRIISSFTYGDSEREIQPAEITALTSLPTTQRIKKTCLNCNFEYMAFIVDKNYNCSYSCLKCKTLHQ